MKILAEAPPERMQHPEAAELHRYAALCRQLHPGWLGEFVAREFETWAELGYRADPAGLLFRVAADLDAEAARRLRVERERWDAGQRGSESVSAASGGRTHPTPPATPRTGVSGNVECHCGAFGSDGRP